MLRLLFSAFVLCLAVFPIAAGAQTCPLITTWTPPEPAPCFTDAAGSGCVSFPGDGGWYVHTGAPAYLQWYWPDASDILACADPKGNWAINARVLDPVTFEPLTGSYFQWSAQSPPLPPPPSLWPDFALVVEQPEAVENYAYCSQTPEVGDWLILEMFVQWRWSTEPGAWSGPQSVHFYVLCTNGYSPDLNLDGVVTAGDAAIFIGLLTAQDPSADLNGDGVVTALDAAWFIQALQGTQTNF